MTRVSKLIIVDREGEKKPFTGEDLQAKVDEQGILAIHDGNRVVAAFPQYAWWVVFPEGSYEY